MLPAVRVLAWPRWLGNPYLPQLLAAMRRAGLDAWAGASLHLSAARLRRGDWLHLHWPGGAIIHPWRPVYAARAAALRLQLAHLRRRGVRVAWTAHNLLPHDDRHPDLGRAARRDLLARVDHVFLHFAAARDALADAFGYAGPTTVVHHPHYLADYPAPPSPTAARDALGLPTAGFVALNFGALRPYKGLGDVIRAFRRMAGPDDRLVLAGLPDGDISADLKLAADDPRVVVHARRIADADVPRYYAAADVAIVAHRAFFTSGSALLALSMGCPLVGPPVHHLTELAGEQRLVPCELGPEGLAAGLIQARAAAPTVDRPAIRAWAAQHGTWDDAAASIAAVFRSPPSTV